MKKILKYWYLVVIAGFCITAAFVFILFGESSIISVHDNLDLFIPQFQMMKDTGTFFSQGADVPFLGSISRDNLPSELSLYTVLFMILPAYPAYIAGYLIKIGIGIVSFVLLARDIYGEKFSEYRPIAFMMGFAYGLLNMFPAFSIPFASIPLVVCFIRKIYKQPSFKWYVLLFLYPFLSYFSYFGLFILAYLCVALIWLWLRDKKFPKSMLLALIVLSAGYIVFEYRLFGLMLFSSEETIRATMDSGSMTGREIFSTTLEVFAKGIFHAESVHTFLVMPVCGIYFLFININYLRHKNWKGIFHDLYNLLFLILLFNSVVYGIYYWEGLRSLIEKIIPPLEGWQFNRTVFFSPLIWYAAFFLVLKGLYDSRKTLLKAAANVLALLAVLVIVFSGTRYNDFYHTCVSKAYEIIKGKTPDQLSFGEYYSKELFDQAKEDIGYCGQWAAAYGFHPAVLEYNGIATLDGYLGFYSQSYKEAFRKVIAPALDRVEDSRIYYDTWGARVGLFSGSVPSIVNSSRTYVVEDKDIYMDTDAFKALGGRYIFSRIELSNAEEAGLSLKGTYTDERSPYTLYVYQTISRYQTKQHSGLNFDAMKNLAYDSNIIKNHTAELTLLAADAESTKTAKESDRVILLYKELERELSKAVTCRAVLDISCYQNVNNKELWTKQERMLKELIDLQDKAYLAFGRICRSAYQEDMLGFLDGWMVKLWSEYEEMTDRVKEISVRENELNQEYEQAVIKNNAGNGQKNKAPGEIFLELVALRNEEAQLKGYDDYAEYAYTQLYLRDYTVKDAKSLFKDIRQNVLRELDRLSAWMYRSGYDNEIKIPDTTAKQRWNVIGPYLDEIDPELKETFNYMVTHELYDMDFGAEKSETGFTVGLPYYNDAFIYDNPYGGYQDYYTAIHEFGHYHYIFRNAERALMQQDNVDLCEIHSQGMEALYYQYDDEIVDRDDDLFGFMAIYNMAEHIRQAAMISDFEIRVYQKPDMSLEEINRLFLQVSGKYGYYFKSENGQSEAWTEITHLFSAPCYYVSYLTSAFTSLEIFNMAKEDRHEAVEKYMEITTLPTYAPYCSAMRFTGMQDIFKRGVPGEIIKKTNTILNTK